MHQVNYRALQLHRRSQRRGMSLYVTVLTTAFIVSILALTGLNVVRIERRKASNVNDRIAARANARSAVELALCVIAKDSDWRTTFNSGQETTALNLGNASSGTVSWILSDSDGSLTDGDTLLRLSGIGRVGNTTQLFSTEIKAKTTPPLELRSQTSSDSQRTDELLQDKWWGQYFKVTLPPEAIGWRVTSVELMFEKNNGSTDFSVNLRTANLSNMPSSTVLDSVDLNSGDFDNSMVWRTIDFSTLHEIAPSDGVCLTLETTAKKRPVVLAYRSGGVSESDSALVTGDPSWNTYETDKALMYRIHGVYWTLNSEMLPITGTWRPEAAP